MPRDFADWRELPSDVAEREEIRVHIARALYALPDIYREAFILRDVERLSAADAAAALGISVAAMKVRLHRARLMMRESLTPHFASPKVSFWERLKGKNPWLPAKP